MKPVTNLIGIHNLINTVAFRRFEGEETLNRFNGFSELRHIKKSLKRLRNLHRAIHRAKAAALMKSDRSFRPLDGFIHSQN